jgi:hypothetical protein
LEDEMNRDRTTGAHIAGTGEHKTFQIASPSAGQDFTIAVPTGKSWKVNIVRAVLTAAAGGSTRTVSFDFRRQGSLNFFSVNGALSVGGGVAGLVTMFQGGTVNLPCTLVLSAGDTIASYTSGIAAGDAWSQITVTVEEWDDNLGR